MFGIMSSVLRTASRTEPFEGTPFDRGQHLVDPREAQRRQEREELDRLTRYRRGYW